LRKGGAFARFANHPYIGKGNGELNNVLQEIYSRYMPGSRVPREYTEDDARKTAAIALKYGFVDIRYKL
jgi:hypothetical protein